MASGGLFPQLLVIPLHRDHNVITMAGGKNDVIKLLPALTITEDEVNLFLDGSRRCSRTCMARAAITGGSCARSRPRR